LQRKSPIASQSSDCFIGFVSAAAAPQRLRRVTSSRRPADVSKIHSCVTKVRIFFSRERPLRIRPFWACARQKNYLKRIPFRSGALHGLQSGCSVCRRHGPIRQFFDHLFEYAGGSSRCHRQPARADPAVLRGRFRRFFRDAFCNPNRARKVKRAPGSPWLSTHTRPPISSASCAHIARPSPVPPYFLVVEVSACAKASKILFCLSIGCRFPCL